MHQYHPGNAMLPVRGTQHLKFSLHVPQSLTSLPVRPLSGCRIYKNELALAALLLIAAARSLLEVRGMHFYFLIFQGFTFLVVGLDLINDRQ